MTEFDKRLIEKANKFRIWDYQDVNVLSKIADTQEAKDNLESIREDLLDLVKSTI